MSAPTDSYEASGDVDGLPYRIQLGSQRTRWIASNTSSSQRYSLIWIPDGHSARWNAANSAINPHRCAYLGHSRSKGRRDFCKQRQIALLQDTITVSKGSNVIA